MRIFPRHLKPFLPEADYPLEEWAEMLSMIGHETEVVGDALEVKVFPNRGDVLSLRGLTRDVAALYPNAGPWKDVEVASLPPAGQFLKLNITAAARPLILSEEFLKIGGYTDAKSPEPVVDLLKAIGLQPKNLLVDLTNIVAYEVGVPLHAFDAAKIEGGLSVELLQETEMYRALNGKEYPLGPGALVARNNKNGTITDLLGVMGGADSAIDQQTESFLLQAASFEPKAVRRNSRLSTLATEASYRYQRGVDPELPRRALGRFLYWLQKYASGIAIESQVAVASNQPVKAIPVDARSIERLLGTHITSKHLQSLEDLGFALEGTDVRPPSWRFDIAVPADIAEEVARKVGLNTITPQTLTAQPAPGSGAFQALLGLKHQLKDLGFTETMTYSFAESGPLGLRNPRSDEQRSMRTSLKDGLLRTLARNPYLPKALFFEIGAVFLPEEKTRVGLIVSGLKESQVEQLGQTVQDAIGLQGLRFEAVSQDSLDAFNVKQRRVFWVEFLAEEGMNRPSYQPQDQPLGRFRPISKFPPVVRDLTLVVDRSMNPATILKDLDRPASLLFAEHVDSFESEEKLGPGKVALTFRLFFQDLTRSLTDQEASEALAKIVEALSDTVKFEVR